MNIPRLTQSPIDPGFVQNPYPFYKRVRDLAPLVWWDDYAIPMATNHASVGALLRDRRFGRECPTDMAPTTPAHLAPFYAIEAHSMLELEPPRHSRLRGLVLRAFTSRRIAGMGPEIGALCHQLIDGFPDGNFDLLGGYATPIPVIIIARLLGVPEAMAADLLGWSNAMVAMYQARRTPKIEEAAARAATEFADFLRGYIKQRRALPADDLITHLITAEAEGEKLTTDELISTCVLLLNAGHEATVHTIGNGVKALLEVDESGAFLAPAKIAATVEEILRYDPPLHMFTRYAYEDVEVFGHRFKRGDQVGLLLGAAGRDPTVYPEQNRFQPSRTGPAHLAFGGGIHFCVGAPLARLELQFALTTLFTRLPNLTLAEAPQYGNVYPFHGLIRLIVT